MSKKSILEKVGMAPDGQLVEVATKELWGVDPLGYRAAILHEKKSSEISKMQKEAALNAFIAASEFKPTQGALHCFHYQLESQSPAYNVYVIQDAIALMSNAYGKYQSQQQAACKVDLRRLLSKLQALMATVTEVIIQQDEEYKRAEHELRKLTEFLRYRGQFNDERMGLIFDSARKALVSINIIATMLVKEILKDPRDALILQDDIESEQGYYGIDKTIYAKQNKKLQNISTSRTGKTGSAKKVGVYTRFERWLFNWTAFYKEVRASDLLVNLYVRPNRAIYILDIFWHHLGKGVDDKHDVILKLIDNLEVTPQTRSQKADEKRIGQHKKAVPFIVLADLLMFLAQCPDASVSNHYASATISEISKIEEDAKVNFEDTSIVETVYNHNKAKFDHWKRGYIDNLRALYRVQRQALERQKKIAMRSFAKLHIHSSIAYPLPVPEGVAVAGQEDALLALLSALSPIQQQELLVGVFADKAISREEVVAKINAQRGGIRLPVHDGFYEDLTKAKPAQLTTLLKHLITTNGSDNKHRKIVFRTMLEIVPWQRLRRGCYLLGNLAQLDVLHREKAVEMKEPPVDSETDSDNYGSGDEGGQPEWDFYKVEEYPNGDLTPDKFKGRWGRRPKHMPSSLPLWCDYTPDSYDNSIAYTHQFGYQQPKVKALHKRMQGMPWQPQRQVTTVLLESKARERFKVTLSPELEAALGGPSFQVGPRRNLSSPLLSIPVSPKKDAKQKQAQDTSEGIETGSTDEDPAIALVVRESLMSALTGELMLVAGAIKAEQAELKQLQRQLGQVKPVDKSKHRTLEEGTAVLMTAFDALADKREALVLQVQDDAVSTDGLEEMGEKPFYDMGKKFEQHQAARLALADEVALLQDKADKQKEQKAAILKQRPPAEVLVPKTGLLLQAPAAVVRDRRESAGFHDPVLNIFRRQAEYLNRGGRSLDNRVEVLAAQFKGLGLEMLHNMIEALPLEEKAVVKAHIRQQNNRRGHSEISRVAIFVRTILGRNTAMGLEAFLRNCMVSALVNKSTDDAKLLGYKQPDSFCGRLLDECVGRGRQEAAEAKRAFDETVCRTGYNVTIGTMVNIILLKTEKERFSRYKTAHDYIEQFVRVYMSPSCLETGFGKDFNDSKINELLQRLFGGLTWENIYNHLNMQSAELSSDVEQKVQQLEKNRPVAKQESSMVPGLEAAVVHTRLSEAKFEPAVLGFARDLCFSPEHTPLVDQSLQSRDTVVVEALISQLKGNATLWLATQRLVVGPPPLPKQALLWEAVLPRGDKLSEAQLRRVLLKMKRSSQKAHFKTLTANQLEEQPQSSEVITLAYFANALFRGHELRINGESLLTEQQVTASLAALCKGLDEQSLQQFIQMVLKTWKVGADAKDDDRVHNVGIAWRLLKSTLPATAFVASTDQALLEQASTLFLPLIMQPDEAKVKQALVAATLPPSQQTPQALLQCVRNLCSEQGLGDALGQEKPASAMLNGIIARFNAQRALFKKEEKEYTENVSGLLEEVAQLRKAQPSVRFTKASKENLQGPHRHLCGVFENENNIVQAALIIQAVLTLHLNPEKASEYTLTDEDVILSLQHCISMVSVPDEKTGNLLGRPSAMSPVVFRNQDIIKQLLRWVKEQDNPTLQTAIREFLLKHSAVLFPVKSPVALDDIGLLGTLGEATLDDLEKAVDAEPSRVQRLKSAAVEIDRVKVEVSPLARQKAAGRALEPKATTETSSPTSLNPKLLSVPVVADRERRLSLLDSKERKSNRAAVRTAVDRTLQILQTELELDRVSDPHAALHLILQHGTATQAIEYAHRRNILMNVDVDKLNVPKQQELKGQGGAAGISGRQYSFIQRQYRDYTHYVQKEQQHMAAVLQLSVVKPASTAKSLASVQQAIVSGTTKAVIRFKRLRKKREAEPEHEEKGHLQREFMRAMRYKGAKEGTLMQVVPRRPPMTRMKSVAKLLRQSSSLSFRKSQPKSRNLGAALLSDSLPELPVLPSPLVAGGLEQASKEQKLFAQKTGFEFPLDLFSNDSELYSLCFSAHCAFEKLQSVLNTTKPEEGAPLKNWRKERYLNFRAIIINNTELLNKAYAKELLSEIVMAYGKALLLHAGKTEKNIKSILCWPVALAAINQEASEINISRQERLRVDMILDYLNTAYFDTIASGLAEYYKEWTQPKVVEHKAKITEEQKLGVLGKEIHVVGYTRYKVYGMECHPKHFRDLLNSGKGELSFWKAQAEQYQHLLLNPKGWKEGASYLQGLAPEELPDALGLIQLACQYLAMSVQPLEEPDTIEHRIAATAARGSLFLNMTLSSNEIRTMPLQLLRLLFNGVGQAHSVMNQEKARNIMLQLLYALIKNRFPNSDFFHKYTLKLDPELSEASLAELFELLDLSYLATQAYAVAAYYEADEAAAAANATVGFSERIYNTTPGVVLSERYLPDLPVLIEKLLAHLKPKEKRMIQQSLMHFFSKMHPIYAGRFFGAKITAIQGTQRHELIALLLGACFMPPRHPPEFLAFEKYFLDTMINHDNSRLSTQVVCIEGGQEHGEPSMHYELHRRLLLFRPGSTLGVALRNTKGIDVAALLKVSSSITQLLRQVRKTFINTNLEEKSKKVIKDVFGQLPTNISTVFDTVRKQVDSPTRVGGALGYPEKMTIVAVRNLVAAVCSLAIPMVNAKVLEQRVKMSLLVRIVLKPSADNTLLTIAAECQEKDKLGETCGVVLHSGLDNALYQAYRLVLRSIKSCLFGLSKSPTETQRFYVYHLMQHVFTAMGWFNPYSQQSLIEQVEPYWLKVVPEDERPQYRQFMRILLESDSAFKKRKQREKKLDQLTPEATVSAAYKTWRRKLKTEGGEGSKCDAERASLIVELNKYGKLPHTAEPLCTRSAAKALVKSIADSKAEEKAESNSRLGLLYQCFYQLLEGVGVSSSSGLSASLFLTHRSSNRPLGESLPCWVGQSAVSRSPAEVGEERKVRFSPVETRVKQYHQSQSIVPNAKQLTDKISEASSIGQVLHIVFVEAIQDKAKARYFIAGLRQQIQDLKKDPKIRGLAESNAPVANDSRFKDMLWLALRARGCTGLGYQAFIEKMEPRDLWEIRTAIEKISKRLDAIVKPASPRKSPPVRKALTPRGSGEGLSLISRPPT